MNIIWSTKKSFYTLKAAAKYNMIESMMIFYNEPPCGDMYICILYIYIYIREEIPQLKPSPEVDVLNLE